MVYLFLAKNMTNAVGAAKVALLASIIVDIKSKFPFETVVARFE